MREDGIAGQTPPIKGSSATKTAIFKNVLEKFHINVTIRRSMGQDICAACGQLRREHMK
jgi:23S rRNA (adenine2503-C2)-methyltransferase